MSILFGTFRLCCLLLILSLSSSPLFSQYQFNGPVFISSTGEDSSKLRVQESPPGEKSTALAMLLSAALPGAGQVYTERYVSIPIIWGFGAYFGGVYSQLNNLKQDYASQYDASLRDTTMTDPMRNRLREIRDFYRDERDTFAIYLALTYLLNIVDAYVGAALYGFDVSPDLTGGARATLRLRIQ